MSNIIIKRSLEKASKVELERHALSGNHAVAVVAKEMLAELNKASVEAVEEEPVVAEDTTEETPSAEPESVVDTPSEESVEEAPKKTTRKRTTRKKADSAE